MNCTLGIDYGRKNIGLSLANSFIAEPLLVLSNNSQFLSKLQTLIKKHSVDQLVIGLSENKMAQETKKFAATLTSNLNLPLRFHDETLTSRQAQSKLAHKKKSHRQKPQDAYQATLMLQDYLDSKMLK